MAQPHPDKGGHGVFATAPIAQGELVCVWSGHILSGAELSVLPDVIRIYAVQVEEDHYLTSLLDPAEAPEPADYINHSCNPNIGFDGQIVLRAIRPIAAGEEVCIDYAMCDGSPYDEFRCMCGAPNCRGWVRGTDWQLATLQQRYAGQFTPFIQAKINQSSTFQPTFLNGVKHV